MSKPRTLTIRLTEVQYQRPHGATKLGPYRLQVTDIVVRGIDLATKEIEATIPRAEGRP